MPDSLIQHHMTAEKCDRPQITTKLKIAICSIVYATVITVLVPMGVSAQDDTREQVGSSSLSSRFQKQLNKLGVPLTLPPQGKSIVVNIPAFELIALEHATPVFRSRVIVGSPLHRTPRLETFTTSVRIRPTWRPTPSMVASGEYQDRIWPPGSRNPLGLAALRLEPGLLVYLHDTNRRELFDQEMRALSHGCIRVQRWDDLMAWALDMSVEDINRLANGIRTLDLPTDPIPVYLGYYLRFPDENGIPVQHPDIYELASTGPVTTQHSRELQQAGICLGASES